MGRVLCLLILSVIHLGAVNAQQYFSEGKYRGLPLITTYTPQDYNAHEQIWQSIQGPDGKFYFANGDGLLVYDNQNWTLINLTNRSHVRSFCFSSDSTLFISGDGEIGFLQNDESGQMLYVSLVDQLPENSRIFDRPWTTVEIDGKIYFQTYSDMFIWDGKSFEAYHWEDRLLKTYYLMGSLYGGIEGRGLARWTGKSLELVENGSFFADYTIRSILPYDDRKMLIATEEGGLFLYDVINFQVSEFSTQAGALLKGLVKGERLSEDLYFFGGNGGCFVNKDGDLLLSLTTREGLSSNRILSVYMDQQQNLWLGTQFGITRIDLGTGMSIIDERLGVGGSVNKILEHEGQLFVATREGLFFKEAGAAVNKLFEKHPLFQDNVWYLLSYQSSLFIGSSDGVFVWQQGKVTQLNRLKIPSSIIPSSFDDDLVWASVADGCIAMRNFQGQWEEVSQILGIAGSTRGIVEVKKDEVWLGSRAKGVYRLRYELDAAGILDLQNAQIQRFSVNEGLPPGDAVPYYLQGQLIVHVKQEGKFYELDADEAKFVEIARLPFFNEGDFIQADFIFETQADQSLWISGKEANQGNQLLWEVRPLPQGSPSTRKYMIPSRYHLFNNSLLSLDGQILMAGKDGILEYQLEQNLDGELPVQPIMVSLGLHQENLAFLKDDFTIPYFDNAALRFSYAAPFFSPFDDLKYQTRLLGFEEEWSPWSADPFKEYTNLWEGKYEFQVRAQNSLGQHSQLGSLHFRVFPPWYRQLWMYGAYLLCLITLVFGVVSWRSFRLEQKNLLLERTVEDRTAQISEQRNQLKEQSDRLKSLDQLKSRFFTNISHEFRTPLTLIMGLLQKQMQQLKEQDLLKEHQIMLQNAKRLLRLINQLLELSKFDGGSARLQASQQDIVGFVYQLLLTFAPLARQKNIQIYFFNQPLRENSLLTPVKIYFEPEKMEQVFTNLLSNAIKFTPENGKVEVSLEVEDQMMRIHFANTGPGIPAESLPYVFDRFYQASDKASYEGTGIGLALVKELVELHHGQISVQSEENSVTTFTVALYMGRHHLMDEEIVGEVKSAQELTSNVSFLLDEPSPVTVEKEITDAETSAPILLIAEDHAELRDFIRSQFKDQYQVLLASDGEEGIELAETYLPDLIISDVMMPKVNGLQFCQQIKDNEKTSHIPFIMLTAKAARDNKLEGLQLGADDYLIKPFDIEELKLKVENLIKSRQHLREKFSAENMLQPSKIEVPSQQQKFVNKLIEVMEEHLNDEQFGVEKMGEELGMSRSQVHRKVKAITNQAPSDLIKSYRLQKAAELIRQDAGNFSDIAYMTGFSSLSHFSRSFHEVFGCSPTDFKKQYSPGGSKAPLIN